MNKGILLFAFNNEKIDYVKQAKFVATRAKKYLDLPTTLITDNHVEDGIFDNVILFNKLLPKNNKTYRDRTTTTVLDFKNRARMYAYDLSPYDETIILDTDIVICNNQYNNVFQQTDDLLMYSDAYDITLNRNKNEFTYVSDIGCKFYWATCVYFKKTKRTNIFFDLLKHISENYSYYKVLYELPTNVYRNDYAFSIAAHIMNNFSTTAIGKFPGTLYYSTDKDSIINFNNNDILFLSENNITIKTKGINVHCMNKFNLESIL